MNRDVTDYIALKVIEYYANYPERMNDDIIHTQQVVNYTHFIAKGEGLDDDQVEMLEVAAWLHDIGCPKAKELYGESLPVNQERIGCEIAEELLSDMAIFTYEQKQWLASIVGSHHQYKRAIELEFQPLFEADLIVNIISGYYSIDKAQHLYNSFMTTRVGKQLFKMLIKGVEIA